MTTFKKLVEQAKNLENRIIVLYDDDNVKKFLSLINEQNAIFDSIKEESRKQADLGKKIVIDDDTFEISVVGKNRTYTFVWAKAKENWPQDVLERVRSCDLDAVKVAEELKLGNLTTKQVSAARKILPESTPAVKIFCKRRPK